MKEMIAFPTIDMKATGQNILALRKQKGYSVKDLQAYFGFEKPQAIYKWQWGECLPSVDNLYALSLLFQIPIENILVGNSQDVLLLRFFPSVFHHPVKSPVYNVFFRLANRNDVSYF